MRFKYRIQPVFVSKYGGREIYLPSELCAFEGIPDEMKKNRMAMKEVFKHCSIRPEERHKNLTDMTLKIINSGILQQWGIHLEENSYDLNARILDKPGVYDNRGKVIAAADDIMRNLSCSHTVQLDDWVFAYQRMRKKEA